MGHPLLNPKVGGFECCRFNTRIWDVVIQKIYEIASHLSANQTGRMQTEPDLAIYAVGSYGRQELCYYSDVDLVYTSSVDLEDVYDEKTLELIRLFYDFIDSLSHTIGSLKFSFIYRPFVDIDRWNYQDITALIDMRFLAGDDSLTTKLKNTVRSRQYDISIVLDLLKSKEKASKESDDTIYLNQPNIKEGRGGLRTLQYALWMFGLREFVSIPELYDLFDDGQLKLSLDFMLKVRNLLHFFADAAQDVLLYRDERNNLIQQEIAQALGYGGLEEALAYDFMKDYYSHAKYLHFRAESLIGSIQGSGIHISKALGVTQSHIFCLDDKFEEIDADELFQLFAYFQQYDFEIDARLSTFIFTHIDHFDLAALKQRIAELMARSGSISKALTRMHRLGIMERILPEFERAMMMRSERSLDPYTVGKHTLAAIEHLDEIGQVERSEISNRGLAVVQRDLIGGERANPFFFERQSDASELEALNEI